MKKPYVEPQLTTIGSVHELTLGNLDGQSTDRAFPTNTPKKDLRFS